MKKKTKQTVGHDKSKEMCGGRGLLQSPLSLKFKVAAHFGSIITRLLQLVFPFWPDAENSYCFVKQTHWLSQIKCTNIDNFTTY